MGEKAKNRSFYLSFGGLYTNIKFLPHVKYCDNFEQIAFNFKEINTTRKVENK